MLSTSALLSPAVLIRSSSTLVLTKKKYIHESNGLTAKVINVVRIYTKQV